MPQRIGFDVSALCGPAPGPYSRGIRRIVENLVPALEARGTLEVVRLAPADGQRLRAWRQRELPARAAREELAGIHSFTSAFPWRGQGARVHTVHELPWRHGVREHAGLSHRFWARIGALRADRVVCGSELVERDLVRSPLVSARKVRVVRWGVEERFSAEPPPGVIDEAALGRHRLGEEPYLFCPGAVRAKKNLAAVLHALAERRQRGMQPLRVVVTGPGTRELRMDLGLASRLGLARWIATIGEVEDGDLPALYRLASAVVVLSRSEGFAFPVLEGLACGVPVLVPGGSAQDELAGAAGIVVDPARPPSVAAGIERALEERGRLRALGIERARGFTWEAAAARIEALWLELA